MNFLFYSNKEKANEENSLKRKSDFTIAKVSKKFDQDTDEENSMFYLDETELSQSYLVLEKKIEVTENLVVEGQRN